MPAQRYRFFLLANREDRDYIRDYNSACQLLDSILKFYEVQDITEEKAVDANVINVKTQKNLEDILNESFLLMRKMKNRISEFPEETEEKKAEKKECILYFNKILTALINTTQDPDSEQKRAFLYYLLNWPKQQKFRENSYYRGIAITCLSVTFALLFCSVVFQLAFLPVLANASTGMIFVPILSVIPSVFSAYQHDKYNAMYFKSLVSSSIPEKMENLSTIALIKERNQLRTSRVTP